MADTSKNSKKRQQIAPADINPSDIKAKLTNIAQQRKEIHQLKQTRREKYRAYLRERERFNKDPRTRIDMQTLDGMIHEGDLTVSTQYFHYAIWFGAVCTIGAVALYKMAN